MIQTSYAWVQGLATIFLVGLFLIAFTIGFWLRASVKRGIMRFETANRIINWSTNTIGLLCGPVIVLLMIAVIFPSFSRWMVNAFLPNTTIWQNQFQIWMDQRVEGDLSATGFGALLRATQLGLAMAIPFVGFAFRSLLRFTMGGYHLKESIAVSIGSGTSNAPILEARVDILPKLSVPTLNIPSRPKNAPSEPDPSSLAGRLKKEFPGS